MSSNNHFIDHDDDNYRQPIKQTFDRIRDETMKTSKYQIRKIQNQSLFYFDPQQMTNNDDKNDKLSVREKLFQPPFNLIFRGNFESACNEAFKCNKWLLVSVHNNEVFPCHLLNRDLWKFDSMKQIISKHFIFWPVLYNSIEARDFVNWYMYDENHAHIAILDPITRECKLMFLGNAIEDKVSMVKHFEKFLSTTKSSSSYINESLNVEEVQEEKVKEEEKSLEDWKVYLGNENDKIIKILINTIDSKKHQISMPCTSKFKALWLLLLQEKGCDMKNLKLLRAYNKLMIDKDMWHETLENCGIKTMDTFYLIYIE